MEKKTVISLNKIISRLGIAILLLSIVSNSQLQSQEVFKLGNEKALVEIHIKDGKIHQENLSLKNTSITIENDADFEIELQWSHWRAPEKNNNGENQLVLSKKDFEFIKASDGQKGIELFFKGPGTINLQITYLLDEQNAYLRRNIAVYDSVYGEHFLHKISARKGTISDNISQLNNLGGFGQPIAFEMDKGSAFIGLEYPSSTNNIVLADNFNAIDCFQYFGEQVSSKPVTSANVIIGLFPDKAIKHRFMKYVASIAATPAKPYTLYNSWYDLRAADYPRPVPDEYVMNEKNVFKIIELIKENMIDKHNIKLDAFVLDDGWDVYESDWVLRKKQFPNGMRPIANKLKETDTDLGIWFGPTGGYSARMKRINWMKEHGYEAVSNEYRYNAAYLCMAGSKYSELFRERTVDFVENHDVRYFKWDGIQFSCSNPTHGHPVGIYSRRAVMESVIDKCKAVRANHSDVYLNITSGTWLSPWWVKYASQIWMDGGDYGWADLPSFNKRDAAITYRDFVLYDDFKQKNLWFPISHLMTHGIIKGNLQMLGGEKEPLDKFTDNALLYFARGVSMYELYISPTILSANEWNAISKSLIWARENFDVLSSTFMIGGNPTKGEPYGYVHFKESEGIVATRNPYVEKNKINITLHEKFGLKNNSEALVLERIYPTQWISPNLYKIDDEIEIELGAYETAIFKVYPLDEATKPLVANAIFEEVQKSKNEIELNILRKTGETKVLNPDFVKNIETESGSLSVQELKIEMEEEKSLVQNSILSKQNSLHGEAINRLEYNLASNVREASVAILVRPSDAYAEKVIPQLKVFKDTEYIPVSLNGTLVNEKTKFPKGGKVWYTFPIPKGENELKVIFSGEKWEGDIDVYFMGKQKIACKKLTVKTAHEIKLKTKPPKPWEEQEIGKVEKVITESITIE